MLFVSTKFQCAEFAESQRFSHQKFLAQPIFIS